MAWREELGRQGQLMWKTSGQGSESQEATESGWTEVSTKNVRNRGAWQKHGAPSTQKPRNGGQVQSVSGAADEERPISAFRERSNTTDHTFPRKLDSPEKYQSSNGNGRSNGRSGNQWSPRSPRPMDRSNSSKSFRRQNSSSQLSRQSSSKSFEHQSGQLSRQSSTRSFEPNSPRKGRGGGRGKGHKQRAASNNCISEIDVARKLFTGEAPLPTEEPIWRYFDENDNLQGPFISKQMMEWFKAGYFANGLLVCGMERRVSPPNLPDKGLYRPLGELLHSVWTGIKFEAVTLDVILDRKAKIAAGIEVDPAPTALPPPHNTEKCPPDAAAQQAQREARASPESEPERTTPDRDDVSTSNAANKGDEKITNGKSSVAYESPRLAGAYSWADEMDGLIDGGEDNQETQVEALRQKFGELANGGDSQTTHQDSAAAPAINGCGSGGHSSAEQPDAEWDTAVALFRGEVFDMEPGEEPRWWYYGADDSMQGPYIADHVLEWFEEGQLSYDLLMCAASKDICGSLRPRKNFYRPLKELLTAARTGVPFPLYTKACVKGKKKK